MLNLFFDVCGSEKKKIRLYSLDNGTKSSSKQTKWGISISPQFSQRIAVGNRSPRSVNQLINWNSLVYLINIFMISVRAYLSKSRIPNFVDLNYITRCSKPRFAPKNLFIYDAKKNLLPGRTRTH